MGEKRNQPFHLSFNASLKIDFQGSRVTSDGDQRPKKAPEEKIALRRIKTWGLIY